MTLRNEVVTAASLYGTLTNAITNVYNDVLSAGRISSSKHKAEFALFNNPTRVPEGSWYVTTKVSQVLKLSYSPSAEPYIVLTFQSPCPTFDKHTVTVF